MEIFLIASENILSIIASVVSIIAAYWSFKFKNEAYQALTQIKQQNNNSENYISGKNNTFNQAGRDVRK